MSAAETKSEHIEVPTTPSMKTLLQRVPALSHRSITEFLLEAGMSAAEDAPINKRSFRLDAEQRQAFQDALDRPVIRKPRLVRLMTGKSVLDLAGEGEGT